MIEIIVGGVIYTAALLGCYDGDTCKVRFEDTPKILEVQTLRFEGFDTPELRGKCESEKEKAKVAKRVTIAYMTQVGKLNASGKRGKYGRLLVTAPKLQKHLIETGHAKPYDGGTRESWCD
ncbi:hypothetical protein N8072_01680 [bacterium]|nr:hypothetical protein [bacterium]MDB4128555.1 hypothetical protein [bacterium]MDC1257365.1 hypothetical protein [bacterium]